VRFGDEREGRRRQYKPSRGERTRCGLFGGSGRSCRVGGGEGRAKGAGQVTGQHQLKLKRQSYYEFDWGARDGGHLHC